MKTDKKPIWNLIGEIFEDIHRIGAGFALVGLLADFTTSAAIAVFLQYGCRPLTLCSL